MFQGQVNMTKIHLFLKRTCLLFRKLPKNYHSLYRISGKVSDLKKLEVPGPGEYKPIEKAIEGPRYGFGTGPRVIPKRDESPGPGAYKLPSQIANLPSHALANQNEEFKFV